jgi:CRP-like cAMP-binding protein
MTETVVDFGILAGAGAPVRSFKAGEVIFRQGDAADELYIVKSGKVEIRLGNRLLDTLPELSIFGEMALIDHSPRSATAVAATDATVVPVGEKQFLFLVSRTPHFALNVMQVLAQRLRSANSVVY